MLENTGTMSEGKKKLTWKCPIGHPKKGTRGWKKRTIDDLSPHETEELKRNQLRREEEYE